MNSMPYPAEEIVDQLIDLLELHLQLHAPING